MRVRTILYCFIRTTSAHGHFPVYSPTLVVIVYGTLKPLNLQQPSRKPIPAYSSIWQGVGSSYESNGVGRFGGLSQSWTLLLSHCIPRGQRQKMTNCTSKAAQHLHTVFFFLSMVFLSLNHRPALLYHTWRIQWNSTGFTFLRVSALHHGHLLGSLILA